jgi:predicted SAM-dependent methyltransferase
MAFRRDPRLWARGWYCMAVQGDTEKQVTINNGFRLLTSFAKYPMSIAALRARASRVYGGLAYRRQIAEYFGTTVQPRLNVGCGHNTLEGWMNVDLHGGRHGSIFMDASRRWPLPNNAFDAILCEHLIEHLPKDVGLHLLVEAFRVLKPSGKIRVVTPDLNAMARLILDPSTPEHCQYLHFVAEFHGKPQISNCDAVNYIFYWYGHRYIYTVEELTRHFRAVGFGELVETRAGRPVHEIFRWAEGHPNFMGLENDAMEAFALEAVKPAT